MKKMLTSLAAVALATAVGLTSTPLPSFAAQPPRVKSLNCRSVPSSGTWWTVFYGEKTNFWGYRESYNRSACFKSEKDCKAWLYWAQSDWPDMNRNQGCRKGKPR